MGLNYLVGALIRICIDQGHPVRPIHDSSRSIADQIGRNVRSHARPRAGPTFGIDAGGGGGACGHRQGWRLATAGHPQLRSVFWL